MPEQNPVDFKKVLEQSTAKTNLQDLQRRGVSTVKVLDERTLLKLIQDAVQKVIGAKGNLMSERDRALLIEESKKELDRLMRERQELLRRTEEVSRDRASLERELENLQRQIETQKRYYEDRLAAAQTASPRVRELEEELARIKGRFEYMQEQVKFLQEQADRKFQEGVKSQEPFISDLRARLQAIEREKETAIRLHETSTAELRSRIQSLEQEKERAERARETLAAEFQAKLAAMEREVEEARRAKSLTVSQESALQAKIAELAKKDDLIAEKLTKFFTRAIDGLTRKISALKPGGVEADVEFTPNEHVLDNLLKQELESNLGVVSAKTHTASGVEDRLARLRSIRGSMTGKEDETKPADDTQETPRA